VTATLNVNMYGAVATLKAIRDLDPAAAKAVTAALRKTVEPIKQRGQDLVPEVPLTNWYNYGWQNGRLDWWSAAVKRGIAIQIKGGRPRGRVVSSLVAVINRNAAGAVFELAGKVNGGNRLDRGLQASGHGSASRLIWKAFDDLGGAKKAAAEVESIMKDVERQVQAALNKAGGSP
jgi:hypothetical protein